MTNKKLYIFDLDGTLADAYHAIEKSLNFTLKKIGLPTVSYLEAKRKVGRGDRIFMETFFPKESIKRALKIYRAHHKEAVLTHTRLKPNAKKILHTLRHRGKITAIASNRPSYFTNLILKALGISKYFNLVLCADQLKCNKPNPRILNTIVKKFALKKQDAVFVGDMDIDLKTAKRAKIDFVFIRGGSTPLSAIRKHKDIRIINSLKEILGLYN